MRRLTITGLSLRNLRDQRARSMLCCAAIALSAMLIVSVASLAMTMRAMMLDQALRSFGDAHARIAGLTTEQIGILRHHREIAALSEVDELSARVSWDLPSAVQTTVQYADGFVLEGAPFQLGGYPQALDQIAVSGYLMDLLGMDRQLGQRLTLDLDLTSRDAVRGMRVVPDALPRTFAICGILADDPRERQLGATTLLVSRALADACPPQALVRSALFRLNNAWDVEGAARAIARHIGAAEADVAVNEQYVNLMGGSASFLLPFAVAALIMAVAAFLVIYNVFHISVVSRVRQLGMLAAIGMTPGQRRALIRREGLLLALPAIPAGMGLGYVLSAALAPLVSAMVLNSTPNFQQTAVASIRVAHNPVAYLAAALIALLAVVLALRGPAKLAGRIGPVEAMRFSGAAVPGKRRRARRATLPGMALANLMRSRRRTLLTMCSLVFSGVLFLLVASMTPAQDSMEQLSRVAMGGDFRLMRNQQLGQDGARSAQGDVLPQALARQIQAMPGVLRADRMMYRECTLVNSLAVMPEDYKRDLLKDRDEAELMKSGTMANLICAGDGRIQELLEMMDAGDATLDGMKAGNVVLLLAEPENRSDIPIGQPLRLHVQTQAGDARAVTAVFGGWVDTTLPYLGYRYGPYPLVAHQSMLSRMGLSTQADGMLIRLKEDCTDEQAGAVEAFLTDYAQRQPVAYSSRRDYLGQMQADFRMINLIFYAITGIIFAIGMLNLVNTTATSILTRQKELGTLQAMGMTQRQLAKMLQLEGLFLGGTSALAAVILGCALGSKAVTAISGRPFRLPLVQIALLVSSTLLVQGTITLLLRKRLAKDSVIERIRYSG